MNKNDIINNILKPLFKENGFKTSGNHYQKVENDFIKVFNTQFSQFNNQESLKLTFNLGFYFPKTSEFEKSQMPKNITVTDCQIQERYGLIFNNGIDYWLEYNPNENPDKFIDNVRVCLNKCLEWFNKFNLIDDLIEIKDLKDTWTTYRIQYDIAMSKYYYDKALALQILKDLYKDLKKVKTNWSMIVKETIEKIDNE